MKERIAVFGMGQMGANMASRLTEQGFDVLGYDINPARRQELAERQVAVADTVEAALAGRPVVLTSLPDPAAAKAAWLAPGGLVDKAAPGTLIIELSTLDPDTMRDIAAAAAAKGIAVLDCPVSGGPMESLRGELVLIVGGDMADIRRAEPVLQSLGQSWSHTGPIGTAKAVKLVNNMMSMGNVLIACEAFALGEAAGVAPETLYQVLSQSGGRSFHFTKRFPKALKNDFDPGFKMELGEKDLALAIDFGRALRQPTPATSAVRELMAQALATGHRGRDVVALLEMFRGFTAKK
ncbi:MAG: NAD(P)-dependent oxidoreductase [Roseomonas sp.]|nr:NAD(P)-dependent oxidoreductase [Roseomonas sp.]MCA3308316.1 NAD(P)-dependent oxidoreductase [Roseomonas sp.]MCA3315562.1 NAD(P)-dependent oxidoreductase [Roseomonas sp.]MCA3321183.1 NAD(P)-dependent oxidoreductase [Roseomonas sp.]